MVRTYTQRHVYHHRWEVLIEAYNRKFPTNKYMPYLLRTETLETVILSDTAVRVRRRYTLDVDAPTWLKKVFSIDHAVFLQSLFIDTKEKILRLETTNETLSHIARGEEVCTYRAHPDNCQLTLFSQTATMTILVSFFGLGTIVSQGEKWCLKIYVDRIEEGRHIDELLVQDVYASHTVVPETLTLLDLPDVKRLLESQAATSSDASHAVAVGESEEEEVDSLSGVPLEELSLNPSGAPPRRTSH